MDPRYSHLTDDPILWIKTCSATESLKVAATRSIVVKRKSEPLLDYCEGGWFGGNNNSEEPR
jgi:hypothetical protein